MIRLLCVDDSPVILSLLKKIFSAEPGFEVVATAQNGLEAAEMLKKHKVDAVTLDIHMPNQSGLEYLQKNFGPNHPPVIMVTSVSREDSELGLKCLQSGARDFVEKPALNNVTEKGEELRMKVRCAVSRASAAGGMAEIAKSFARSTAILNPERKLRVIVCGLADRERVSGMLRDIKGSQPATLVLVQGAENLLQGAIRQFSPVAELWDGKSAPTSGILVADLGRAAEAARVFTKRRVSLMVVGDVTGETVQKVGAWGTGPQLQLLVEEAASFSKAHRGLCDRSSDTLPLTSFIYSSDTFLSRDI